MLRRFAVLCALGLLLGAPAFGQSAQGPARAPAEPIPSDTSASKGQSPLLLSRLLGATVVGADHQAVGVIDDLIFDSDGRVRTAIVGLGGFLDLGEKDIAVPFATLSTDLPPVRSSILRFPNAHYTGSSLERVLLPMTVEQLSAAPAFQATSGPTPVGVPSGASGTPQGPTKGPKSSTEAGGPG